MTGVEDFIASNMVVHALWCDQGMAHVIDIFEHPRDPLPKAMVVIDFGVEELKKTRVLIDGQAAPAVAYLIDRLKAMDDADVQPKIDLFIVSHQDGDHWSMIPYFVKAVEEANFSKPLIISKVLYGGKFWKDGAIKNVALLKPFVPEPKDEYYLPWKDDFSDYETPDEGKGELTSFGGIVFRTLIVNAPVRVPQPRKRRKPPPDPPKPPKATPLQINGTSAVVVIECGGRTFIFPGDATWETFKRANEILDKWTDGSPLMPCRLMSAPHHGALDTISSGGAKKANLEIFDRFIAKTQPYSVVVSAGINNSFHHPIRRTLESLGAYIGVLEDLKHNIVFCDYDGYVWYTVFNFTPTLYTSVLTDSYPLIVANWHFMQTTTDLYRITSDRFEGVSKETLETNSGGIGKQTVGEKRKRDDTQDTTPGRLAAPAPARRVKVQIRERSPS
ncbi:hypothetical protein P7L70_04620 (plasmid) [Tistrella mobilis]|uniref:hypothetical protein n=1 Tax=Tistrella mobilis TaxID=171437 RepID=UPI003555FE7E